MPWLNALIVSRSTSTDAFWRLVWKSVPLTIPRRHTSPFASCFHCGWAPLESGLSPTNVLRFAIFTTCSLPLKSSAHRLPSYRADSLQHQQDVSSAKQDCQPQDWKQRHDKNTALRNNWHNDRSEKKQGAVKQLVSSPHQSPAAHQWSSTIPCRQSWRNLLHWAAGIGLSFRLWSWRLKAKSFSFAFFIFSSLSKAACPPRQRRLHLPSLPGSIFTIGTWLCAWRTAPCFVAALSQRCFSSDFLDLLAEPLVASRKSDPVQVVIVLPIGFPLKNPCGVPRMILPSYCPLVASPPNAGGPMRGSAIVSKLSGSTRSISSRAAVLPTARPSLAWLSSRSIVSPISFTQHLLAWRVPYVAFKSSQSHARRRNPVGRKNATLKLTSNRTVVLTLGIGTRRCLTQHDLRSLASRHRLRNIFTTVRVQLCRYHLCSWSHPNPPWWFFCVSHSSWSLAP